MNDFVLKNIADTLAIKKYQVENTIELYNSAATIPFIARYRKERTGGLDEVQIEKIIDSFLHFSEIESRKITIISSLEKQNFLTPELKKLIDDTWDENVLEDIYLPYKPKKRTRATIAKEKGLEPFAELIFSQKNINVEEVGKKFLNDSISSVKEAIEGAMDIIAETINEDSVVRERVRKIFEREAVISSKVIKSKIDEAEKYKDYFDFSQKLSQIPSHRLLAIRRAENEGFLKVNISPSEENVYKSLRYYLIRTNNESSSIVETAMQDSYKRLIKPSIETEFANSSKIDADTKAITVFAENLRQLLLSPPLGEKRIMGIDPGYRTGCKLVCIDENGNLLFNETIYPHKPQEESGIAIKKINTLVSACKIDAIAIGNGTASRETEFLIKKIHFDKEVEVYVVSEDGASVYSASSVAREEFPNYDVTVRGAVSIARRLQDPLAELVKIDPKSIGVGQYQHDVDQKKLKNSLDRVVESVVNSVGVNLNTASKHLLTYVSGLGPVLAQNIVDYRKENAAFLSRNDLKKIPRLGEKAFEQSAGFLRIKDAENPLDNTAVHPESYHIVEKISKNLKVSVVDLVKNPQKLDGINPEDYQDSKKNIGIISINEIIKELKKQGLEGRTKLQLLEFDKTIHRIEDVQIGMQLRGIITNITNFGAFVDVGIKPNGLIHLSEICDKFISTPTEVLKLHQHINVKVIAVDLERKRLQFSMKGVEQ